MSHIGSEHSEGTLVKDQSKSTDGWEMRADGKWYKMDYYKAVHEEKKEQGMEILERFFVGSWAVAQNEEWMNAKRITKVLVLGGNSGISLGGRFILRVLEVTEDNLGDWLDEAVSLIKEAISEGEASGSAILMVCRDMKTFCPIVVIAYLMAVMGWNLQTARERVEGIFSITIAGFAMFILTRWEEVLASRKTVSVKKEVLNNGAEASPVSVIAAPAPSVIAAPAPVPVMTVTNPIALAPPVTYANPMFYNAPATSMYSSYTPQIYAPEPVVMAPAVESYVAPSMPAYQSYQTSSWPSSYTSGFSGYNSYPSYAPSTSSYSQMFGADYSSYVQPSVQSYVQPQAQYSYVQQQPSYQFQSYQAAPQVQYTQAAAATPAHHQQQQVVQTTTTTNSNVLRGTSSWHSGGVKVPTHHHGHHGHF